MKRALLFYTVRSYIETFRFALLSSSLHLVGMMYIIICLTSKMDLISQPMI